MSTDESPSARPDLPANARAATVVIFQILLVVIIPAALTLLHVDEAVTPPPLDTNPTPLGYTWSLLLFVVPILYLLFWFLRHPHYHVQRKAFGTSLLVLIPLGFLLDFFFAHTFFVFPNTGAVLGIDLPGIGGGIPIEEFIFYAAGFVFVLLLYIWADEYWMGRYNPEHSQEDFQRADPLLRFHWQSVLTALVLLVLAVAYKKLFAADPAGFPLYWTYLLAAAFLPSAGFIRSTARFVNWRAFSFALILVLLISLLWEASLASPYQWWGYQSESMTGIFITAWNGLPIEAVFVWMAVTFTTVILYEVITICLLSRKGVKTTLWGSPRD